MGFWLDSNGTCTLGANPLIDTCIKIFFFFDSHGVPFYHVHSVPENSYFYMIFQLTIRSYCSWFMVFMRQHFSSVVCIQYTYSQTVALRDRKYNNKGKKCVSNSIKPKLFLMNTCLQPAFNQKKIEKQQINIVLMKGAFILKVFLPPIMTSNYFPIMNIRSGRFIAVFMYNCQNHLLPTNFIKERTRVALTVFNCPFP